MTQRHQAGAPASTGGQFKAEQRPVTDIDLTAPAPISREAAAADFDEKRKAFHAASESATAAAVVALVAAIRDEYPTAKYLSVWESDQGDYYDLNGAGPLDADGNALADDDFEDDEISDALGWPRTDDLEPFIDDDRLDLDALLAEYT